MRAVSGDISLASSSFRMSFLNCTCLLPPNEASAHEINIWTKQFSFDSNVTEDVATSKSAFRSWLRTPNRE